MIAVIPASGALIGVFLHLFIAYWFGIRLRRRSSKVRNEVYILSAVGFFFLGFMMMDGPFEVKKEGLVPSGMDLTAGSAVKT